MRHASTAPSARSLPADSGARPLAIYTDRSYLTPGMPHVPLLTPAWGPPFIPVSHPDAGMYDAYARTGQRIISLVAPDEAEAFVLPSDWVPGGANPEARRMGADAERAGKPLLVFFLSDSEEPVPLEEAWVFRTSLRRSRLRPKEYALSAPGADLVERYCGGTLVLRDKAERPVVGFCGYGFPRDEYRKSRLRAFVYWTRSFLQPRQYRSWLAADFGRRIRMRALEALAASPRVTANIVERQKFMDGVNLYDAADQAHALHVRQEYVTNLLESDYVLCVRGAGNFSFRFYETLCCGRIPVIIDTDIALPYPEWIDWREHCVWVPQAHVAQTGDYIADFHARLTPEAFLERQRAARALWTDWLSPQGFHANLFRYLR